MASAWGVSWDLSWGDSWGTIDGVVTSPVDTVQALIPQSMITSWGLSLYAEPAQQKGAPEREKLKPVSEWTMEYLLTLNEPVYEVPPEDTFDYGYHFWSLLNGLSA